MIRLLFITVSAGAILLSATSISSAAQRHYRQGYAVAPGVPDRYCLQGRIWGYPGNCQFATYEQCMATASGTHSYCGVNPTYAFAQQRAYQGQWYPR